MEHDRQATADPMRHASLKAHPAVNAGGARRPEGKVRPRGGLNSDARP